MKRYFISLQYDGSNYHGWQKQPNGITVEETIEKSLSIILRRETDIVGAGRTDAGVHAYRMTAHFDAEECDGRLKDKLNKMLPKDISILNIEEVNEDLHARFSAKSRMYRYYIHTRKDVFAERYSVLITYPLNFERMNEAAELLKDYTDFGAFCKTGSDVKTTICKIFSAEWKPILEENSSDKIYKWYFEIKADRFLRNMVRAIVGTLIDVGRGKISLDEFKQVIEGKSRSDAGESMPAKGLFLYDVEY